MHPVSGFKGRQELLAYRIHPTNHDLARRCHGGFGTFLPVRPYYGPEVLAAGYDQENLRSTVLLGGAIPK